MLVEDTHGSHSLSPSPCLFQVYGAYFPYEDVPYPLRFPSAFPSLSLSLSLYHSHTHSLVLSHSTAQHTDAAPVPPPPRPELAGKPNKILMRGSETVKRKPTRSERMSENEQTKEMRNTMRRGWGDTMNQSMRVWWRPAKTNPIYLYYGQTQTSGKRREERRGKKTQKQEGERRKIVAQYDCT